MGIFFKDDKDLIKERAAKTAGSQAPDGSHPASDSLRDRLRSMFIKSDEDLARSAKRKPDSGNNPQDAGQDQQDARQDQQNAGPEYLDSYKEFRNGQDVYVERSPRGSGNFQEGWRISIITKDKSTNTVSFIVTNDALGATKNPSYETLVQWQREAKAKKEREEKEKQEQRAREQKAREDAQKSNDQRDIEHPAEYRGIRVLGDVTIKSGAKFNTRGWIVTEILLNRRTSECSFKVRNNTLGMERQVTHREVLQWDAEVLGAMNSGRNVNEYEGMRVGDSIIAPDTIRGNLTNGWKVRSMAHNPKLNECIVTISNAYGEATMYSFEDLKKLQDDYKVDMADLFSGPNGTLAPMNILEGLGENRLRTIHARYDGDVDFARRILNISGPVAGMNKDDIKKAYISILRTEGYHPDHNGNSQAATVVFQMIGGAKATLEATLPKV